MKDNDNLADVLRDSGLRGALQWLNARAPFRYTAIYVTDANGLFKKVYLFDRENPRTREFNPVSVRDRLCALVVASGTRVAIPDTHAAPGQDGQDGHTEYHEYDGQREDDTVRSFYGLPLQRPEGRIFGVVCHFDPAPNRLTDPESDAFAQAGALISETLIRLCGM